MTDQEIIDVVKARQEGKTIQRLVLGEWIDDTSGVWDFLNYRYRVRPEKYYRPYKTPEEVFEAIKLHGGCNGSGGYVKQGNTYRYLKKFTVMENGEIVYSFSGWNSSTVRDWESIHKLVEWADGTPFGKLEE